MRKIEFRGKRSGDNVWVYGSLLVYPDGDADICCFEGANCVKHITIDPNTVGQCTGMKDKNDEDIYEGDILEHKFGGIGIVKFNQHWGSFCYSHLTGRDEYGKIVKMIGSKSFYSDSYTYKIVGNIYDSRELVEASK